MKKFLVIISVIAAILLTSCTGAPEKSEESFFAMDTYMKIDAYGENGKDAVSQARARVEALEKLWSATDENSEIYGECIQAFVKTSLQNDNTRVIKPCGKNIYPMYHTTKPAVLVECGFMSNGEELQRLLDKEYRKKLNFCILNGILNGRKTINNG